MNIPEGYNERVDGSYTQSFSPTLVCDSCGHHTFTLVGLEKEGRPDMFVCDTCLYEMYQAQAAARDEAARIEAANWEAE